VIDTPGLSAATGPARPRGPVRQLLSANAWALVGGAVATVVVGLAVPVAAVAFREGNPLAYVFRGGQLTPNEALATLAVCTLWAALAAPALAASGPAAWDALVRGGIVADASVPALLVLWALCPQVTFVAAVKIYCVLAAMVLFGTAGRYAAAALASVAMLIVLASPFWVGGAIHNQPRPVVRAVTEAAVLANPFYAVTASVTETMRFTWHQAGLLYRLTRIGDYAAAPPLSWYPAVAVHLAAAAALGAVAAILGRLRRGAVGN